MNRTGNQSLQRRLNPQSQASGDTLFKWLAILALLATAASAYFLFTGKQARQVELAELRAETQQELDKQTEELERLRNQNKEIGRLRAESQEVIKLRGEAARLRVLQQEQQKLQAEKEQLSSTVQQLQQVGTENSTLRNQNQQLQGALADRANIAARIANLKIIEQIKARWATDLQKQGAETPLDSDLFGPRKYLPQKPVCPVGGVYTVGLIQARPTCSIPGHIY